MKITIPFPTPTINHLYFHRGNIKILKTEARQLRDEIIDIVNKSFYKCEVDSIRDKQLIVNVQIYDHWFNLNGTIKKKDILNKEKFLIDSIFKGLEIDDSHIFKCSFTKIHVDEELECKSVIRIREVVDSELQS